MLKIMKNKRKNFLGCKCEDCVYYDVNDDKCHRKPPVLVINPAYYEDMRYDRKRSEAEWEWPDPVNGEMWCGEFVKFEEDL